MSDVMKAALRAEDAAEAAWGAATAARGAATAARGAATAARGAATAASDARVELTSPLQREAWTAWRAAAAAATALREAEAAEAKTAAEDSAEKAKDSAEEAENSAEKAEGSAKRAQASALRALKAVGVTDGSTQKEREARKVQRATAESFQRMWVAGTMGAFFAAFTSSVARHLHELSLAPDWFYTSERVVRYGFLLWLLAYFFRSNLGNTTSSSIEWRDLVFDVLQSVCALAAAIALDFIVPGAGYETKSFASAMSFANAAVFVICGSSLCLLGSRAENAGENSYLLFSASSGYCWKGVNRFRTAGAAVSFVAFLTPFWGCSDLGSLVVFALALFLLFCILAGFWVLASKVACSAGN